jgi:hypothetical protein
MPPKDNSTHFDSTSSINTLLRPHSLYNRDFQGSFNNNYSRGGRISHQELCALLDMALDLVNVDDATLQEMDIDAEIESSDRQEASPTNEPPQD